MNGFLVAFLVITGLAIAVLSFVLGVYMIVWNVNDIIAVGVNFWNVFWLALVGIVFFSCSVKVAS